MHRGVPETAKGTSFSTVAGAFLAGLSLAAAYPAYWYTLFIDSIDLGENDFMGLVCLGIEAVLLGMVFGGGTLAIVLGVIGVKRDRRRWLPWLTFALGAVVVCCFSAFLMFVAIRSAFR